MALINEGPGGTTTTPTIDWSSFYSQGSLPATPTYTAPAQTASTSFVRRAVEPIAPVPAPAAPTLLDAFIQPQGTQNILGGVVDAFINTPYQDARQYDLSSQFGTQQAADIYQRQYTIPQFGEQPTGFGISNNLNQQQLAEAARLTGDAMFTYGQLPSVISSDVASHLPYNPTSDLFKGVMQESFGVDGFETYDEFLTKLGYVEYEDGKWEIQDPISVTGYGSGVYQSGGTSRTGGYSAARGSGYGYSQGGSLVNWRIGF